MKNTSVKFKIGTFIKFKDVNHQYALDDLSFKYCLVIGRISDYAIRINGLSECSEGLYKVFLLSSLVDDYWNQPYVDNEYHEI